MLSKLNQVLALILLACPFLAFSQVQIKNVSFEEYTKKQVNEQVFLHTDRDVYAPGDTIWFKAYVRNKINLKKADLSRLLHVFLTSKDTTIYQWEKCLIQDSQSEGYIALENSQVEGICNIIAFSSWMNNFEPDCYYSKKILIRRDFGKAQKYTPFFNKSGYFPGETVKVSMQYLKLLDKENVDKNLDFLFKAGTKTALKVNPTKIDLLKPITWTIPEGDAEKYQFRITDYYDFDKIVDIPYRSKINVGFFPEGGNFINGIVNNIAYKAIYDNGQPATIAGEIINEEGEVFAQTQTEHEGMGRFIITPASDEKYFFKINTPEQCKAQIEMPIASDSGWVINARVSNKEIIADVSNSFADIELCYLTLSIRGIFYAYKKASVYSEAAIVIPTSDLPGGIGVLTLLNDHQNPVAERLIFINYNNYETANLLPDKEKSVKMDSMSLKIKMNGDHSSLAGGQFSLSVYDHELGSTEELDEPNIIASTYFNKELKGHISNPNYYFAPENKMAHPHLDLLLMVQGWRKYHYVNKLHKDTTNYNLVSQELISGSLQKLKVRKGFVEIPGQINVYFAGNSNKIQVEENGKFSFYPEYENNSRSPITITGYDSKGKSNVHVTTNSNRFKSELKTYLQENPLNEDNSPPFIFTYKEINDPFKLNLDHNIWLEEVTIVREQESMDISQSVVKTMNPREAKSEDLLMSPSIIDLILNMGINVDLSFPLGSDTIAVTYIGEKKIAVAFEINGAPDDYGNIKHLNPANFEYFYIARGVAAKLMYGSEVAVIIKMKENIVQENPYGENPVTISRPQVYKEFYHPKYDSEEKKNPSVPDLRKTIYWNPNIVVDENGEATVTFYNAQRITTMKCILQGMTKEGNPVYGEAFYKVLRNRQVGY